MLLCFENDTQKRSLSCYDDGINVLFWFDRELAVGVVECVFVTWQRGRETGVFDLALILTTRVK